ncbi:MAG: aldehyde dehydrogenase (NADP(+)) [Vicinamibacterales bacterium]
MTVTGQQLIAGVPVEPSADRFTAHGAPGAVDEASAAHVDQALRAAEQAFDDYRHLAADRRAALLEGIAEEVEALGDDLLAAAHAETALPIAERLAGERARTLRQLRLFADLVRDGSWVDARIDRANPALRPPRPDIRRMLVPIGPVAVFTASNFPLAFSVAGTDTASALAAGCPVVVKGHPAHPATAELTARAVIRAVARAGVPAGVFSLLQSTRNDIALAVVRHPLTRAVAFTGSLTAGRALYDAGTSRPDPIPVYAEMGSINPVFLLPGALDDRAEAIADGLFQSMTLGVGQFCTCPGVAAGIAGPAFDRFVQRMEALVAGARPGTMLYPRILQSFETGVRRVSEAGGVRTVRAALPADAADRLATPTVFIADASAFLAHQALREEVFGPATVIVRCASRDQLDAVAGAIDGQLTATVHGSPVDLAGHAALLAILERKAGRLIVDGFPTGVEVCASMQHGGPYPATTDARTTSVGTAAIDRFVRPIAYQNWPAAALPVELQDANPRGLWRRIDGELTRDAIAG